MDQEESFESAPSSPERESESAKETPLIESAPSTPERESESAKETPRTEEGGDVVNGDTEPGDTTVDEEASDSVDNKVATDTKTDISDDLVVNKASETVEDVTETEEAVEG